MPKDTPDKIEFKTDGGGEQSPENTEAPLVNENVKFESLQKEIARLDESNNKLHDKLKEVKEENKNLRNRALEAERKAKSFSKESRVLRIYVEIVAAMAGNGTFDPATAASRGGQKHIDTMMQHAAGLAQVAEHTAEQKGF